jgi:hypothetical protein
MRAAVFLPVVLTSIAYGQAGDPDPVELMRKSVAPRKANEEKVRQYAYRERQITRTVDKNGKETDSHSETWDVIGLEGSTYRRLVQKNDKPLPAKEEKREEERLRKESERRKKETPEQRRNRPFSFSYSFTLDFDRAADMFDLRSAGEETVGGRSAWVIEGLPKPGFRPANDMEKEARNYRMKVWLDRADMVLSRVELEIITDGSRLQKGSVIRGEDLKSEDGVWLSREVKIDFKFKFLKLLGPRGDAVTTYTDYHKFQVDSRVLDAAGQ